MPDGAETPKEAYRSHMFRLQWDGRYVAGMSKASALNRTMQAITLERGLTHDPAFVQWAKVMPTDPKSVLDRWADDDGSGPLGAICQRKDIVLEMYNERGQKVIGYKIYRCWPSAVVMLPDEEADGFAVAISMLRLEYEGWERDTCGQEGS